MFIEHSGFLLPRSVSRCRGVAAPGGATLTRPTVGALFWPLSTRWRCAYPAYGWCIVLPLSTRWRYAYPAYGWCIVLAVVDPVALRLPGLRLVHCSSVVDPVALRLPGLRLVHCSAVVDPVALRLPGLRCVHRFAFCRPGKRSATGRKGALFKQGVDIILFVVQRRVQFFNLK
ncbi:hypothetical protein [Raoultella ornithinolytica]|uniref:hypothetical protein n=1 Tax=Raoultella ornithinolytica TaxID=54291 RepID=UPI0012FE7450|nr:hypothetical protein [Raoultella ornithinolytica]